MFFSSTEPQCIGIESGQETIGGIFGGKLCLDAEHAEVPHASRLIVFQYRHFSLPKILDLDNPTTLAFLLGK